jgi:hypothetical protein
MRKSLGSLSCSWNPFQASIEVKTYVDSMCAEQHAHAAGCAASATRIRTNPQGLAFDQLSRN